MKKIIARGLLFFGAITGGLLSQNLPSKPPETAHVIDSTEGPALYKAYCAVCHGIHGRGDGPMAPSLKTRPPDLTEIAQHNAGTFPREAVEKIISGEAPRAKGHGPREMPIWGPLFSQIAWDQDLGHVRVYNLASYIAGMQAK